MKRLFLFVLIAVPVFSFSQEEFPVFSEDNIWRIRYFKIFYPDYYGAVHISGDTIIDGRSYKIINDNYFEFPWGCGYEENNQTFFRPIGGLIDDDILIYDFNLEIGDTFNLPSPISLFPDTVYTTPIIVQGIDYVQLNDGSLRKRYTFEGISEYDACTGGVMTWIDGIGSPMHPTYLMFECFESGVDLDCYNYQGEELHGECLYLPTTNPDKPQVKAQPNPFSNEIKIINPGLKITSSSLYDIKGKQVAFSNNSELLNLEYLPSGVYILEVKFKDGSRFVHKMVK